MKSIAVSPLLIELIQSSHSFGRTDWLSAENVHEIECRTNRRRVIPARFCNHILDYSVVWNIVPIIRPIERLVEIYQIWCERQTCVRRGLTRVRPEKKNWSLRVILASPTLPPSTAANREKILFDLKAIAFATKQKSWFRRKGNFAYATPSPNAAIYAIIYRHGKRVITFHCFRDASACNCNRSSQ